MHSMLSIRSRPCCQFKQGRKRVADPPRVLKQIPRYAKSVAYDSKQHNNSVLYL